MADQNILIDVICYPYTFPIGIINEYIYTLPFCYSSVQKDIDFGTKQPKIKGKRRKNNDDPYYNVGYDSTLDVDHNRPDIKSGVKMDILIDEVSSLVKNNVQTSHIEQIAGQTVNVTNEWYDTSKYDKYGGELSTEEYGAKIDKLQSQSSIKNNYPIIHQLTNWNDLSEDNEYKNLRPFYNKKTKKVEHVKPYFCRTNVDQKVTETIEQITEVKDDIKEKIVNKIKGHIKEHLNEMGVAEVPLQASVSSMDKIHNELKNNVTETINQTTTQITKISSKINYIDRYGYCDIERDPNNENYGREKGKLITQESELKTLSKNIINNSIDIAMKNDMTISIDSTTNVNRVQNSVIVLSLLFDVFLILLIIYFYF